MQKFIKLNLQYAVI